MNYEPYAPKKDDKITASDWVWMLTVSGIFIWAIISKM